MSIKNKWFSLLALLLIWSGSVTANDYPYWRLQDFFEHHPKQEALMAAMAARVSAPVAAQAVDTAAQEAIRVVKVYPGEQASGYWRSSVAAFRGRMDGLGIPYQLEVHFSGPTESQFDRQLAQLSEVLASDPDYLIYTLSSSTHVAVVERILAAGRPRVILQNITTPLRRWDGMQPMMYVGFDHIHGSHMLAEQMDVDRDSGYVALLPHRGYLSEVRGESFIEAIRQSRGITPLAVYHTDLDSQRGYRATLDALQRYPQLGMIYACSTDIALGAVRALREQGRLDEVVVNGWGGGDEELDALARGELSLTVMRINDDAGVAIAEAIALDALGRSEEVPLVFAGEMVLMEQGMSSEQRQQARLRAFRYSAANASGDAPQ